MGTVEQRCPADHPDLAAVVADAIEQTGCAVITDVLDPARCADLVAEVQRVERDHEVAEGTNEFEGFHTRRIFNLISKSELFREVMGHVDRRHPLTLLGIEHETEMVWDRMRRDA